MKTRITVPLSDLTVSGEDGGPVAPEQGDLVTVTIEGRVIETQGDKAIVEVGADESEAGEPTPEQLEQELSAMHEQSQFLPKMD